MATTHKSYRLDDELLKRLDDYSKGRGMRPSEAVSYLLCIALDAESSTGTSQGHQTPHKAAKEEGRATEPQAETMAVLDALRASNADLRAALIDTRAMVATLTSQLAVKDAQISTAHELAGQAQRLQMADIAKASLESGAHNGTRLRDRIASLFNVEHR